MPPPSPLHRAVLWICLVALTVSGCSSRTYMVRESDLRGAHDRDTVIGAVGPRCRETALHVDRLRVLDEVSGTDYVLVRERTARSLTIGTGIGAMVLGTLLVSMGSMLTYDASHTSNAEGGGDDATINTGRAFGVGTAVVGSGFFIFGLGATTRGALRGAEAPRQWHPSMTEDAPCVSERSALAHERARERQRRAQQASSSHDNRQRNGAHPSLQAPLALPPASDPIGH